MIKNQSTIIRKKVFTAVMASALAIMTNQAAADIYVWGDLNGIADSSECGLAPDAISIAFTMLQPNGFALANNSIADIFAQAQTPTCGTFTYDTVTESGSSEIIGFDFFSSGLAVARNVTINRIPDALDQTGNGNFLLANMLFDWSVNIGIPVSLVWDAQGILGEMDGTPSSFTLNSDGSINTANAFSDTGGIPASDGTLTPFWTPIGSGILAQGARPLATTMFNTVNVVGCVTGADGDYSNNNGGGCMNIAPSADIAQAIVIDLFDNTAVNPTQPVGLGGNPMVDGPFPLFNANFDYNDMTLVSFTDTTPPTTTLNAHVTPAGTSPLSLTLGVDTYTEPGATCTDAAPVGGSKAATVGGDTVNANAAGIYIVTYDCSDGSGNPAVQVTREVIVCGPGAPCVALIGSNPVAQECADPAGYTDAGAICVDAVDGDIPVSGDGTTPGTFNVDISGVDITTITMDSAVWSCTDSDSNPTTVVSRTVDVVDTLSPVVTLNGADIEDLVSSTAENPVIYMESGAEATDTCDTAFPISLSLPTIGTVTMIVPDDGPDTIVSSLQYTAIDAELNSGTAIRTVNVTRSQPVISLLGGGLILGIGEAYVEEGMDVTDVVDGLVSTVTSTGACGAMTCTVDSSSVDTNTSGTYTVTYDVIDSDGNNATQLTRTVQVGIFAEGSNFTMLNPVGAVFGGTNDVAFDWDQTFNIDESDINFGKMTIASAKPQEFFSFVWTAHHVRVFGEGFYEFDATCTVADLEAGKGSRANPCNNALQTGQVEQFISMTVGTGQVGAHILFDWSSSSNIDVVNVWNIDGVWETHGATAPVNELWSGQAGDAPDPLATWKLISTDVNGDSINGSPMVDGPFQDFYANFNAGPGGVAAPQEPYTGTVSDTELGGSLLASLNVWVLFTGLLSLLWLRGYSSKQ